MCAICLQEFQHREQVTRIVCRHIFHVACWHDYVISGADNPPSCPACHGSGREIARWRFIAPPPIEAIQGTAAAAAAATTVTPSPSRRSRSVPRGTTLVWSPSADNDSSSPYYHASTQLPDGRLSILVDPGAWTNLCGLNTTRRMKEAVAAAGYRSQQWKMASPLSVSGVGNGTQTCEWSTSVPFAFQ